MENIIRLTKYDLDRHFLFYDNKWVDSGEGYDGQGKYGVN